MGNASTELSVMADPVTSKTWTYAKDPDWRPSMGGLVDPLAALQTLVGLCDEHPIFNDPDAAPEIYAAMFHAKEAAAAWRQVAGK